MEDRVQELHEISACLSKLLNDGCKDFSDLVSGAIIGIAIADSIVSGEIDISDKSANENALGVITAVTLIESLPSSALEYIEKMFS